jgi:hypothetical protein
MNSYSAKELRALRLLSVEVLRRDTWGREKRSPSRKEEKHAYDQLLKDLDDSRHCLIEAQFSAGRWRHFAKAKLVKKSPGKWLVTMTFLKVPSGPDARLFIRNFLQQVMKKFDRFHPELSIRLSKLQSRLKRVIEDLGFRPVASYLMADCKTSLRRLEKILDQQEEPSSALTFRTKFMMKDFKQMMDLEFRSHRSEPNSVVHHFTRKKFDEFRPMFERIHRHGASCLVFHGKIRVGHLLMAPMGGARAKCFTVATICLHPRFQRQGLALWLYHSCLEQLVARRVSHYVGYSSSPGVLRNAGKMGRRVNGQTYCLPSIKSDA